MNRTASAALVLSLLVQGRSLAAEIVRHPVSANPGHYIVVLREPARPGAGAAVATATVSALSQQLVKQYGGTVTARYEYLRGFAAQMQEAEAQALAEDPSVLFVEEDSLVRAYGFQQNPPWGLDRIDQRSPFLNQVYTYNATGKGVNVYVIDSGIRRTHQDFGGRVIPAWPLQGGATNDCDGHGTHVAGTVGGTAYGVAKGATLHAVRVLDCSGRGALSQVLAGIDWVTGHHVKPAVANLSLGDSATPSLDLAVQKLIAAGVTSVVAAGNDDHDACLDSPGRLPEALTIGATRRSYSPFFDQRASFSNKGRCVDLFAPGSDVLSAGISSDTASVLKSGTSMAAPHVAGAVALYLERHPNASPATVNADVLGSATSGTVSDAGGSPNRFLYSDPPFVDHLPVPKLAVTCRGFDCSFDGNGSADDEGLIASYKWDFGDGQTATGIAAQHSYGTPGDYQTTLVVTDAAGQQGRTSLGIAVTDGRPIARVNVTCASLNCWFNGSLSTSQQPIRLYRWSFGDGTSAEGLSVAHPYPAPGIYLVELTVVDDLGQQDSVASDVEVWDLALSPPRPR